MGNASPNAALAVLLKLRAFSRCSGFASWRCDDNHGVTGFDLPEGEALLSVTPECAEGAADPATYSAPAPEQRNVILGDTVSLGAVELVLQVSYCGQQPCICS